MILMISELYDVVQILSILLLLLGEERSCPISL